ncbi:MAG: S-layer homology domain-containing protein [Oscillibacter sp.]|nr:S-layer homology domain-containing protein [Oscillibacter sp.]
MKRQLLCLGIALYLSWHCAFICQAFTDFTDVPTTMYCYTPVKWAVDESITNGTSENEFSPGATCSKKQALTFLWRAFVKRLNPVQYRNGNDFQEAINWAISEGLESENFDPSAPCTRERFVTYLYILADRPNVDISDVEETFDDVFLSSKFASAVVWAADKNITKGTNGSFNPDSVCTRGNIMTFLHRYATQ